MEQRWLNRPINRQDGQSPSSRRLPFNRNRSKDSLQVKCNRRHQDKAAVNPADRKAVVKVKEVYPLQADRKATADKVKAKVKIVKAVRAEVVPKVKVKEAGLTAVVKAAKARLEAVKAVEVPDNVRKGSKAEVNRVKGRIPAEVVSISAAAAIGPSGQERPDRQEARHKWMWMITKRQQTKKQNRVKDVLMILDQAGITEVLKAAATKGTRAGAEETNLSHQNRKLTTHLRKLSFAER